MLMLLVLLTLAYVAILGFLLFHWARIKQYSIDTTAPLPTFSVIVVVRNEEANILALLKDFTAQEYPVEKFEVIIVDDFSTDQTYSLVDQYIPNAPYRLRLFRRIEMQGTVAYKKAALTQALGHATGELVITTDGDCRVGRTWLKSFATCYQQSKAQLISGPVSFYGEKNLFEQMQTIEFASLIGTGAAAMQAGMPLMCNGANLCYAKAAFQAVDGYSTTEHIPSGDDEHLMHKIAKQFPGRLVFNKSKEAVVYTLPKPDFQEFKQQRIRWAGKWRYNPDVKSRLMAVYLFLYHLLLLLFLPVLLWSYPAAYFILSAVLIKLLLESVFLYKVAALCNKHMKIHVLLLLQLVYPLYVVYFGLLIHTKRSYTWKNRELST